VHGLSRIFLQEEKRHANLPIRCVDEFHNLEAPIVKSRINGQH